MGIDDLQRQHDKQLNDLQDSLTERIKRLHQETVEEPKQPKTEGQTPGAGESNTGQGENPPGEPTVA
jgi:hypothetical protein